MPRPILISDLSDPRLRHYVDIRQARAASGSAPHDHFIAEGRLVVRRLIESDYDVQSVLVQANKEAKLLSSLPDDVPVYSLARDQINEVVGFDFHRGVLACGHRKPVADAPEFCQAAKNSRVTLGLLGISDQENMGNMLRTAAAFGIDQILLGPTSIDPLNRRVIRVSMATALKHRFYRLADSVTELQTIGAGGIRTVASTLDQDATTLAEFRPDGRPTLLLVGNEAKGIDSSVQAIVDSRVRIPMQLGTNSLNVATAAAILMHEFTQGAKSGTKPST